MAPSNPGPVSFSVGDVKATAPNGGVGHRDAIEHTQRLQRKLWHVADGVWCLVGNGLSNQVFVEGPGGLIAIDSGESVEEMTAALAAVRQHTQAPVVAAIYTHSHYVGGTTALYDDGAPQAMPIWGHANIVANRLANATMLNAVAGRGLVHQFGIGLPAEGPDALINVGLGLEFRLAEHAPFTPGFVVPNQTFAEPVSTSIAGLRVEMTPAPSDADDSITIWFPDLGVCVNNILWPTLFNVFAIRGEEYRDPRVLMAGIEHIMDLGADHLVCTHGPPMSGAERIAQEAVDYRDSIQFLWDQTVRGMNRGLSTDELTSFVRLPKRFERSWLTRQWYGLAEHHVRQIHNGLRGWFDGDETKLLPLAPVERCRRLIEGFGGAEAVRDQVGQALAALDLRWALELAGWLIRVEEDGRGRADGGSPEDRALLAAVLREIAQRTTAANIRNWCLIRANELEGSMDLTRHRVHRFSTAGVLAAPPSSTVHALRVLLDPTKAEGLHLHVRFVVGGDTCGLQLRDGVAVPTDGANAEVEVAMEPTTLAAVMANKTTIANEVAAGAITTSSSEALASFTACFDHPGLSGEQ